MHAAEQELAPSELLVPGGHGVQDAAFTTLLNVPGGQSWDDPVGVGQYDPGGDVQVDTATQEETDTEAADTVVVPGGHTVQLKLPAPGPVYVPIGQALQLVAPGVPAKKPAGHNEHAVDPVVAVYVPGAHGLHDAAFATELYVPVEHSCADALGSGQ